MRSILLYRVEGRESERARVDRWRRDVGERESVKSVNIIGVTIPQGSRHATDSFQMNIVRHTVYTAHRTLYNIK